MSTLDEITKEKQRVGEALARIDAQREQLSSQLSELEATERVLARYSKGTRAGRPAAARSATTTKAAAPARSGRRGRTAKAAGGKRTAVSLGDQVLALATGRKKSPPHAKGLDRTMSVSSSQGTSGPGASRSATGSSMPRTRWKPTKARSQCCRVCSTGTDHMIKSGAMGDGIASGTVTTAPA